MFQKFKVLTILGSQKNKPSNTRALVEDFVDEMSLAGLSLKHQVISLGHQNIPLYRGCWNCTNEKPCPLSKKGSSDETKADMLDCDMLIMASPV